MAMAVAVAVAVVKATFGLISETRAILIWRIFAIFDWRIFLSRRASRGPLHSTVQA